MKLFELHLSLEEEEEEEAKKKYIFIAKLLNKSKHVRTQNKKRLYQNSYVCSFLFLRFLQEFTSLLTMDLRCCWYDLKYSYSLGIGNKYTLISDGYANEYEDDDR